MIYSECKCVLMASLDAAHESSLHQRHHQAAEQVEPALLHAVKTCRGNGFSLLV